MCWNVVASTDESTLFVRIVDVVGSDDETSVQADTAAEAQAPKASDGRVAGLNEMRGEAANALANRRREMARARRQAAHDARQVTRLESEVAGAEVGIDREQDTLRTRRGQLREAEAPFEDAVEQVDRAKADEARARTEAEVARARADEAQSAPQATAEPRRRHGLGHPTAQPAEQVPEAPADAVVNAQRARADAADRQAESAAARTDMARQQAAAAALVLTPRKAAAEASERLVANAVEARERAATHLAEAREALATSLARVAAAERQLREAEVAAKPDPAVWVKLPAAPPLPQASVGPQASVEPHPTLADSGGPARSPAPGPRPPDPAPAVVDTPLTFIRTAGDASGAWDPMARFIGTAQLVAPFTSRAPTSVTPLDSHLPRAPSPSDASASSACAGVAPLAPLRSDGPAFDGFVLTLFDDEPEKPSSYRPATPGERKATADASPREPVEPSKEPDEPMLTPPDPDATVSVLPDTVLEGAVTAFSVSGHPLAAWMNGIDEALRRGWDYPLEARALGVDGTVDVQFTVLASGRVTDVVVTRADAPPELVNAATGSVPARVKPPPLGWGDVQIRYTYRYRLAAGS